MIYVCKNCCAPILYDPDKKAMCCEYCGSINAEVEKRSAVPNVCPTCNGTIEFSKNALKMQCGSCGTIVFHDKFLESKEAPQKIVPFQISKRKCLERMKAEVKKYKFAPADLLEDAKLSKLRGIYMPFYLYDIHALTTFNGECTKEKTWKQGDKQYREISYYDVERQMTMDYIQLPCDALSTMEDNIADCLEPFEYDNLEDFDAKYVAGFDVELADVKEKELLVRAENRVKDNVNSMMKEEIFKKSKYEEMENGNTDIDVSFKKSQYAMLPVWFYPYQYHGKDYPLYLNGQTGKLVGNLPIASKRVAIGGGISFGIGIAAALILWLVLRFLLSMSMSPLLIPVLAILIAGYYVGSNVAKLKKRKSISSFTYVKGAKPHYTKKNDRFIRKDTTYTVISKNK